MALDNTFTKWLYYGINWNFKEWYVIRETIPMTIKVLSLLQHDYIKLLLSRTFLFLLTFFIFKMSLKRYSSKFYGG